MTKSNPYDVFLQQIATIVLRAIADGVELPAVARGDYEHLVASPVVLESVAETPAEPVPLAQPKVRRPRRDRDPNYRLRVESITYLGDDAAAAAAIKEFLRLRRSRKGRS